MQIIIEVREFDRSDISSHCHFMPDPDEYGACIQQMLSEIRNHPDVEDVKFLDNQFIINSTFDKNNFENEFKYLFSKYFCNVRFVA